MKLGFKFPPLKSEYPRKSENKHCKPMQYLLIFLKKLKAPLIYNFANWMGFIRVSTAYSNIKLLKCIANVANYNFFRLLSHFK